MTWRILIADPIHADGIARLRQEAEVLEDESLASLAEADALIVRSRTKVTAEVLARGRPRLKVVGRAGVGVDNIDLEAAREQSVVVVNAPTALTIAVAELAMGLMLALAREIPRADAAMKAGRWEKKALIGQELHGKTLGIIGVGRIGAALAERAKALGMHVIGYDALLPAETVQARGVEPVSLEALYARADYISLHVPLTEETRGMIDRQALAQMKPGVRLISTARGGVIDEGALLETLESGHVAGAGLDVFEHEPPGGSPLVTHPRVVCTPHIGAQTLEAQRRGALDIAEEILAALRGDSLRWRVA